MNWFRAISDSIQAFFAQRQGSYGGSRVTTSREIVSEDSALNWSPIWCATRLICGTAAGLPLPLYSGMEDEERQKDRKHPLWRLLNRSPNPEMSAYNFRAVMWQWQINWGNAYAEIVREGNDPEGDVQSLWPLHPSRVDVCRDPETLDLYYDVRSETGKATISLQPWKMLHIPNVVTHDGIVGQGTIAHARETIGAGIAAEKTAADTFGNGRMPKVVVKHPQQWKEDVRKAFRDEWKEMYAGANGDQVALLMGGADIMPLSFSAVDSQYIESRQFGIEEVARWYGIPPHLLQHLLRATFNNVEELGIDFVRYCLVPLLRIWEQSITQRLLTPTEQETYFAEHNVDALLRGNSEARGKFYQVMTSAALMTRNECRKLENLPAVDGGDTFLVQGATVPLDEDGKPESDFAGNTSTTPATMTAPEEPDEADTAALAAVEMHITRAIDHDLRRFLTKETKAMANFARKPGEFVQSVEAFFADQAVSLRDEVTHTLGAMEACGTTVSLDVFVTSWVKEGQDLMVEASGHATNADELKTQIQSVLESKSWTERPIRAVQSVHQLATVAN